MMLSMVLVLVVTYDGDDNVSDTVLILVTWMIVIMMMAVMKMVLSKMLVMNITYNDDDNVNNSALLAVILKSDIYRCYNDVFLGD